MTRPFLLAQLTDAHIGGHWAIGGDPAACLRRTVAAVRALDDPVDAVVVTGDLTEAGEPADYERVAELLAELGVPFYVLPGNHDRREALRRQFGLAGEGGDRVCYAADVGPLRLVVLDSTIPDAPAGDLGAEQLAWLDRELSAAGARPTVVAMHHPPLLTGSPPWDEIGLAQSEIGALGEVLARHRQVRRVIAGHLHRTIVSSVGGCPVLAAPSIYGLAAPNFTATEIQVIPGPPGFALHALVDDEIESFVLSVGAVSE